MIEQDAIAKPGPLALMLAPGPLLMQAARVDHASDHTAHASVTNYSIARLRIAQLLIPLALLATVLARRLPGPVSLGAAIVVLLATALTLITAIRREGKQPIRVERGAIWIGSSGMSVPRTQVRRWTLANGVASLYCRDRSYKLRFRSPQEPKLEEALRGLLGAPANLERRGSPRARMVALLAAVFGLVLTVSSFVFDAPLMLVIVGVPCFIFGIAIFATLSQRVIRGS